MRGPAVVMRRLSYWMYSWKTAMPPGRRAAAILSVSIAGEATKQATQRHQHASMPPAGSGSVIRSSS
jgi:hypothetical protein